MDLSIVLRVSYRVNPQGNLMASLLAPQIPHRVKQNREFANRTLRVSLHGAGAPPSGARIRLAPIGVFSYRSCGHKKIRVHLRSSLQIPVLFFLLLRAHSVFVVKTFKKSNKRAPHIRKTYSVPDPNSPPVRSPKHVFPASRHHYHRPYLPPTANKKSNPESVPPLPPTTNLNHANRPQEPREGARGAH